MIIPIRCFTCGKVIADKYHTYTQLVVDGYTEADAMSAVGLQRYCCRRMFLTHVDFSDMLLKFNPSDNSVAGGVPLTVEAVARAMAAGSVSLVAAAGTGESSAA